VSGSTTFGKRASTEDLYHALGTRRVINALGVYTDVGGSRPSDRVWAAMSEANQHFARLTDLLDGTGSLIAGWLGTQAARVTGGASPAIVMAVGACMTGASGRRMEQLPDPAGMPSVVVMQRFHRYKYDRMIRMSGARIAEVGNVNGTDPAELEESLTPDVCAVFMPGHLDGIQGTVALEGVAQAAHRAGVPVIVDAAYLNYPVELMGSFTKRGADLAIFSAKYFGGPNTGGIVCGRADLVAAISQIDFTGFEAGKYLQLGRAFKLDRQLIAGVTVALREWLDTDHAERFARYARLVSRIAAPLADVSGITADPMCFTMDERLLADGDVNCLAIRSTGEGPPLDDVAADLAVADPAILMHAMNGVLIADVECVSETEADQIGAALRAALKAR
jgi:D-glucosaminate-6-phosphate ammonia-lyase